MGYRASFRSRLPIGIPPFFWGPMYQTDGVHFFQTCDEIVLGKLVARYSRVLVVKV